jgi:hypothetical protein
MQMLPTAFPDCWTAYGATDTELTAYGCVWPLDARGGWLLLVAQAGIAGLTALGAVWFGGTWWALLFIAVAVAALVSATVSGLRLGVVASQVTPRAARLTLRSGWGMTADVPWEQVAEIALVDRLGGRLAGLRLRSPRGDSQPVGRWLTGIARRVDAGYDWLLAPSDGDAELLSRILLRYCIDPRARQHYLAAE